MDDIKRIHNTLKEFKIAAGQLVVDTKYNNTEKIAMLSGLGDSAQSLGRMIAFLGGDAFDTMVAIRCAVYISDCISRIKAEGGQDEDY